MEEKVTDNTKEIRKQFIKYFTDLYRAGLEKKAKIERYLRQSAKNSK